MAPPTQPLSINQGTLREQYGFRGFVEACVRNGIPAISPWRDKVADCGLNEAARLIKGNGLRVSGYCRGGLFPAATAAERQAIIDDNKRMIDEAAVLGCECIVLIGGGLPKGSRDLRGAHQMVADGLAAILPHARAAKVPLAMEPLHPMYAGDRACINTLAHALDLCDALGDGLGIAVDVYHVWWDPNLEAQIARAGSRILGFHVCDWLTPTRDMLLDRGMMGDGVIDIPHIRGLVEKVGYKDCIEVEIFSAGNWWKKPGDEVIRTCIERYRTLC
jgi:sugar phosphate isomerase/epimerase